MRVLIFANGEINDYTFVKKYLRNNDTIICCDGGIKHTKALDIRPNFIIGDFDSADKEIFSYYRNLDIPFIPFPVEKDFTDLELCMNFVVNRDAKEIFIFGGIGSRFDHSLANVHILMIALKKNIKATLLNEKNIVQLMDSEIILNGKKDDIVSLIPLTTEVTGITTDGLYYPLYNENIQIGSSRGVSNKFNFSQCKIKIEKGVLIVIQSFD